MAGDSNSVFTVKEVACLVAFLLQAGGSLSNSQYTVMSKVGGTRTASSYDHQFRDIKRAAKEIQTQITTGNLDKVSAPAAKTSRAQNKIQFTPVNAPKATPKKRGRKAKSPEPVEEKEDRDEETPLKKVKIEDADDDSNENAQIPVKPAGFFEAGFFGDTDLV